MFNLPMRMRLDLAELVQNSMIRDLLRLPENDLQASLDRMGRQLRMNGQTPSVVAAYQALAPLLWEAEAVRAYRARTGSSQVANALPELANLEEALDLAQVDYRLSPREHKSLRKLLENRPDVETT